jgi:penicillin-binding protein 2
LYSQILPSTIKEKISEEQFHRFQDQLIQFPGFYALPRPARGYNTNSLANVLGYIGEVSESFLNRDTSNYYRSGDYIGIGGIEKSYENVLRGSRGASYKVVDVQGVVKERYQEGKFDTLPEPGENIHLTVNLELQQYAEKLMEGKVGSVVALEPKTGKILALVSAPSFDPHLLTSDKISENFGVLSNDENKPLFNRALQARYPPGSMFKTIQGMIALHEEKIDPDEKIYTDGSNIGDLAPPGYYDLVKGITRSSNNYFYLVMRRVVQTGEDPSPFIDTRIGFQRWIDLVQLFGLGKKLGVDLPNEIAGNVPSIDYYDRVYGKNRWKYSNIASLSIGQGELLVTPIQMANLAAIMANKGYYITPHVVDQIGVWPNPTIKKVTLPFAEAHYEPILSGMEQVVKAGSGRRGFMEHISLCGKTSTVQNPHGEDHSGFMGFAPKEDPEISIAVYVENAGQGGRAAVSVASLVIEKYISGSITRPWLEDYVLNKRYIQTYEAEPVVE